ncbi:hypothetical protein T310_10203 [Rasamsonia emersonii CBS 393.64]|uniref:Beta-glucuronidase C-terminal domain-containing protein n=1 Tax=Rasamsonia emersonii (strain ATCC 16479 / CBS 393.64 / IMI 116815) TaxID=1408163 RepID=A0A0F4YE74_RASE3|nr:hypothetical protein T310_10203 [Rasamsonia emersonii CBS 393.64]KKA16216.1 hypothetical protein T310_10203 [Rasamsonia emersonii CBS 393.64]
MARIPSLLLPPLLLLVAQTTGLSTVNLGAVEAKPIDRQLISLSIDGPQRVQDNLTETMYNIFEPGNAEAVNTTYSKRLFQVLAQNSGPEQTYIFGLNLGSSLSFLLTPAFNFKTKHFIEITAAATYLNQSRILAYEVGNEPNLYTYTGLRNASWNVLEYADEILDWMPRLREAAGGQRFPGYQFGTIAEPPSAFGDFTQVQLAVMGVPQAIGSNVCTTQQAAAVTIDYYLNHLNTVTYFANWVDEIAAAESLGLPFHMGETGTAGCHGKDGVSNTLGALLREIDYALYATTLGMRRLFFHNGGGGVFYYSMWEPVALNASSPAHVNPTYYSMLFLADLTSDLPTPRVHRLRHLDTYDLAHYAIYNDQTFTKLVILNTHLYNDTRSTAAASRPEKFVNVSPVLGQRVQIRRLTGPSSVAKTGVTWKGQEEVVERVADGVVRVAASEGVVVQVDRTSWAMEALVHS